MDPTIPYTACLIGAIAIYMLLRQPKRPMHALASFIAMGCFAWLLVGTAQLFGNGARTDVFFIAFALIATASAVRMITHHKPVYCALYFILVVLSSAALFLLLGAEFMAFALVIVYAGAILITYMFVLMLAQQSPNPNDESGAADYDTVPREPAAAVVVGFILLALLTSVIFDGTGRLTHATNSTAYAETLTEQMNTSPGMIQDLKTGTADMGQLEQFKDGSLVIVFNGVPMMNLQKVGESAPTMTPVPAELLPNNVQQVGQSLLAKFPVSLELAGVILLMAMFGAVVLARKQIEISEDELREAAGLKKLGFHSDEPLMTAEGRPREGQSAIVEIPR